MDKVEVHVYRPNDVGLLESRLFEADDPALGAYLEYCDERHRQEGVTIRVIYPTPPPPEPVPLNRYSVLTDDET